MGGCCGGSHHHKPHHDQVVDKGNHSNSHDQGEEKYKAIYQILLWVGLILAGIVIYSVYGG